MGSDTPENGSVVDPEDVSPSENTGKTSSVSDGRPKSIVRSFLMRAVLWSIAFGLAHLFGFREYTSILSGTASVGVLQHVFGAGYLILYAGFFFLVPVLLIAAGLLKVVESTGGFWVRTGKSGES